MNHRIPVTDHVSTTESTEEIRPSVWSWRRRTVASLVLIAVVAWLTLLSMTNRSAQASSQTFAARLYTYCETGAEISIYTKNMSASGKATECGSDYIVVTDTAWIGDALIGYTIPFDAIIAVRKVK